MPAPLRNYASEMAGRLTPSDPFARFASKCAFDPTTGCVMWTGTTTHGKGRTEPYGRFWYERRFWLAHRWSAEHIHGFEIDGLEVDHCCPAGPSSLCVEHVKPEPGEVNRALRHQRTPRVFQSLATRRHWLFVDLGIERPPEPVVRDAGDVPFYRPPAWLTPFLTAPIGDPDDCPF